MIEDVQHIADYFEDLISILLDCSYNVTNDCSLEMLPHYHNPSYKPTKFKSQMSHYLKYFRFSNRTQIEVRHDLTMDEFFQDDENIAPEDALKLEEMPIQFRRNSKPKKTNKDRFQQELK